MAKHLSTAKREYKFEFCGCKIEKGKTYWNVNPIFKLCFKCGYKEAQK